jgi:hypothetical protein
MEKYYELISQDHNHTKIVKVLKIDKDNYKIKKVDNGEELCDLVFQNGPIKEVGINGIHNEDIITIVINRLEDFQMTNYSCEENNRAITKLQEALMWLRKRTDNRKMRGVEGTSKI